jgi:hypothetical protein
VRKRFAGNYGEFAELDRQVGRYTGWMAQQGEQRRAMAVEGPVVDMGSVECAVYDTGAKTKELMQRAWMYRRCIRSNIEWNEAAVSSFSML